MKRLQRKADKHDEVYSRNLLTCRLVAKSRNTCANFLSRLYSWASQCDGSIAIMDGQRPANRYQLKRGSGNEGGVVGRQVRHRRPGRTPVGWACKADDSAQHRDTEGGTYLPLCVVERRGPSGRGGGDGRESRDLRWLHRVGHACPDEKHQCPHQPEGSIVLYQAQESHQNRYTGESSYHEPTQPTSGIDQV